MRVLHDVNTFAVVGLVAGLYAWGDDLAAVGAGAWWPRLVAFLRGHGGTALAGDDALLLVVVAQTVMELAFWGICALLLVLDRMGVLEQFRIQPLPPAKEEEERRKYHQHTIEAFKDVMLAHWAVRPVFLYVFFRTVVAWRCPAVDSPVPSFRVLIPQFLGCMLIDDTWFYWAHRAAHLPQFYAAIHKKHHSFHRPNVFATEYAHPLEDVFVNQLGTVGGPVLLGAHPLLLIVYVTTKLYQSMEAHSGFNLPFPFSIWSVIDSMDCAPAHDFHHSHNIGNFGGFFMFWDWACGTDARYREHVMVKKRDVPVFASARRPYVHDG